MLTYVGVCYAADAEWDTLPPADLAATESTWSKGADVEILFSKITVSSHFWNVSVDNYIRVKIYTLKGVEDWGRFGAETPDGAHIGYIVGRVLKPDGTISRLAKSDIRTSTAFTKGKDQWTRTSFAFPNLAPGDVIECKWTSETLWAPAFRLFIQREFPVKEQRFKVDSYPLRFFVEWRNCPSAEMADGAKDKVDLIVRNIPAFETEEHMPPEWDFRAGVMMVRDYFNLSAQEVWRRIGSYDDEEFRIRLKSPTVKKQAQELVSGAQSDDEKLQRLYVFCQTQIDNLQYSETPSVVKERKTRSEKHENITQSAADTLERKLGNEEEINILFAAMARAIGYEVIRANSASREDILNVKFEKGWSFMDRAIAGVKVAGAWRFFSPGSYWTPYGMLLWNDEAVTAHMCADDEVRYETTPVAPPSQSKANRKGRFTLDADGTLTGEIEQTFTGHQAIGYKARNNSKAADEIDKDFRETITKRLPSAEITDIRWENLQNHDFPVIVRYKVRVPGYAEQVGERLVVVPSYFEARNPAEFTAEKRKYPIFFDYAKEEHDDVEIVLPESYQLDHPSAPLAAGKAEQPISAQYWIGYKAKRNALAYKRDFVLGNGQAIAFRSESYPALQKRFADIHDSDMHAIMLKPKAASATGTSSSSTSTP